MRLATLSFELVRWRAQAEITRREFTRWPKRFDDAVYLPYCERFIADESSQGTSLREIAAEASIDCDVLSFAQFDTAFALVV